MIKFEVEQLGRGPEKVRTFILGDIILFRLKGVLTPAESALAEKREGHELVKEMHRQLNEASRPHFERILRDILGLEVVSLHTDMSAKTGERIIVLVVEKDIEDLLAQSMASYNEEIIQKRPIVLCSGYLQLYRTELF